MEKSLLVGVGVSLIEKRKAQQEQNIVQKIVEREGLKMNLCLKCDRYYQGSYGAHLRFAHYGREKESEGE